MKIRKRRINLYGARITTSQKTKCQDKAISFQMNFHIYKRTWLNKFKLDSHHKTKLTLTYTYEVSTLVLPLKFISSPQKDQNNQKEKEGKYGFCFSQTIKCDSIRSSSRGKGIIMWREKVTRVKKFDRCNKCIIGI